MEIKKDYSRILGNLDVEKLLYKPKKRYTKKLAGLISLAIVITKLTHVPEIYPYMESVNELEQNPKRNVNHLLPSFTSVRFFENWDYEHYIDVIGIHIAEPSKIGELVIESPIVKMIEGYLMHLTNLLNEKTEGYIIVTDNDKLKTLNKSITDNIMFIAVNIMSVFFSVRDDFEFSTKYEVPKFHYPLEYLIKMHEALMEERTECLRDIRFIEYDFIDNLIKEYNSFKRIINDYVDVPKYKDFIESGLWKNL
nr:MAG TPA: hypothetical protein [Caudoviricetes sp.]